VTEAGFRFKDDERVTTTAEMTDTIGISKTHLRHPSGKA